MNLPPAVIIWCDFSFETETSYQAMQDQFTETTTTTIPRPDDALDSAILVNAQEDLRSNHIPLVVVRTIEDAEREMCKHRNEKIFVICSGTLGRDLVPKISAEYSLVHKVYIYAWKLHLYNDLERKYSSLIQMFDFHTSLLLRLTRDIAKYFIERGQAILDVGDAQRALDFFLHAEQLEHAANRRAKMQIDPHDPTTYGAQPDFRAHLDLLQGDNGLIARAKREAGDPRQPMEISG